jgi:hypothetical protein
MPASFETFEQELARLVEIFARNYSAYKNPAYDEARLRQEFLNPLFRALGWDIENLAGRIPQHREVEIESRTEVAGRQRRADYLFRTERRDRFVCEAKKPAEELHARYAFQAKRYAWNKDLPLAVLTDFEEFRIYVVGGRPSLEEPDAGLWRAWHFRQLPAAARELWDLLARDRVAAGSIDRLVESLPARPAGRGKAPQRRLLKPDRSRALDTDFLNFLDEARRALACDLLRHNDRADLLEDERLNEAVQRILDRLLFLRICEDRDIDTGTRLDSILAAWRRAQEEAAPPPDSPRAREPREAPPAGTGPGDLRAPRDSLWGRVVQHFRALDRRPPSHVPFFNGHLFKPHFSEDLRVGDAWLADFIGRLSAEESPYLFSVISVEILGTIYERFLGKIVRPHGRGVTIEEKPAVRKAGGVYYTPRYIVEFIVDRTVGRLLAGRRPEEVLELRILDPACGSGSFLLRAFEVVCEHCQQWLTDDLRRVLEGGGRRAATPPAEPQTTAAGTKAPTPQDAAGAGPGNVTPAAPDRAILAAWLKRHGDWCWVDEQDGSVHLTTRAKRCLLRATIHGVDLDPQAVEVTQLSLYLKMLEGETRHTLARERELFGDAEALLPPLEANIKCGNSLIASDFSVLPDDLLRVRAFDWDVQFPAILRAGGFDAVIGNPPWGQKAVTLGEPEKAYFRAHYVSGRGILDLFKLFTERSVNLTRPGGRWGMVLPDIVLLKDYPEIRRFLLEQTALEVIAFSGMAFAQVDLDTVCLVGVRRHLSPDTPHPVAVIRDLTPACAARPEADAHLAQSLFWRLAGYKFNLHLDPARLALLEKLARLPRLGEFYAAHEGIHSGNIRAKLFLDRPRNRQCRRLIFGREEIGRYSLGWAGRWVNYQPRVINKAAGEYANLGHPEYFEPPKIFVRRTGDYVMAVFDDQGFYASNNLFVVLPRGADSPLSLEALTALLNSRLMTWVFRAIQPRVGKVFAELKINQLHQFPLPPTERARTADLDLANHCRKRTALADRLRAARSETERQTLQNAVTAADRQLDALVYELYGLTPEEIALVEGAA